MSPRTSTTDAARIADDGETVKLAFDLTGSANAVARVPADPDRIVIDMAEVNFQRDPALRRASQKPAPR